LATLSLLNLAFPYNYESSKVDFVSFKAASITELTVLYRQVMWQVRKGFCMSVMTVFYSVW